MNVSRPTFARIVADARRKVMVALAGGQALRIEPGAAPPAGGVVRQACSVCGHDWHGADREVKVCPACGSTKVVKLCGAVCPIEDCSCPLRRAAMPKAATTGPARRPPARQAR